ncbi:ribosome-associated translation inhibitor RaiA [Demequina sp. B12]|uniref:ribosome hibernation-promoting factor, HPF/YfiA family n=1 Tax=Demequina sp. B12 TaxID=2992757 RepID=UPI00237B995B|nr:ribosome-associated translation inhibitor RaiA [Demequina sp. B12]MDE0573827.1 ribosome-associated translation inhibitor RaiA [Demequina sp. B12]
MDIAIVGRHTKVSEEMRTTIFEKMEKVEEVAPKMNRAEVHVVHERNPHLSGNREKVEITLHGPRGILRAEADADDRLIALDRAQARILEQLRKRRERHSKRHNNKPSLHAVVADLASQESAASAPEPDEAASVQAWEGAPEGHTREVAIDGTPIVIRSKTHDGVPMTVSEAIDQMELVGHDFYLFHDSESNLPSAVYRRRGWTYGVIHLETDHAEVVAEAAQA